MHGSINNCIVSGNIKFEGMQGLAGGITTWCAGEIRNCGNLADVYVHVSNSNSITYSGGIFTNNGENSEIINCYNKGNITGEVDIGDLYIGGIGGGSVLGTTKNCYNTGDISGKGVKDLYAGGIIGAIGSRKNISSCYSVGTVKGNQATNPSVGMIIGANNGGTTQNIYYKKVDETPGIGIFNTGTSEDELVMQKTEEEIKQDSFVDLLNSGNEEIVWKKDISNVNDGYPIFIWQ